MEDRYDGSVKNSEKEEKEGFFRRTLRKIRKEAFSIIFWVIIIIVVIYLTLFLSSKIGEFESISEMLRFIRSQFR